jgi:hypothetical protein
MKKGSLVLNELMNRGQALQKHIGQARQSATKKADKNDGGQA